MNPMNISILGSGGMNPMHKHSFCTQQNIYNMRVNDLKQTPKITKASFINSPRCFKFLTCSESQSRCLSFSSSHPACFLSQQRQWSPALLAASERHHWNENQSALMNENLRHIQLWFLLFHWLRLGHPWLFVSWRSLRIPKKLKQTPREASKED